jgi:hypothetical protein
MFEKLINELKNLDGMKISIPIELDGDGYFDRECPDSECLYQFKVKDDDWTNIFKDESVFCPMCGKESTSDTFNTTEQAEIAERQVSDYIEGKLDKALVEGARDFNRKQPKGGFISMSISVSGARPERIILPIGSMEKFERKIKCEKCNAHYAVIGSAFFCPSCGNNSVEQTFDNTIETIESSIRSIPAIREALSQVSRDDAEMTCRSLIEKGLSDCVVAFQRYCDIVYRRHKNAKPKTPFNAFQKLDVGADLWMELINETYSDWITSKDLQRINILFQRRHLLAHTEGIVDQMYVDKTRDMKYKVGQRIITKEEHVVELKGYVKVLVDNIRTKAK